MNKFLKPSILASFCLIFVIFTYFSFNAPYMADNFVFSRSLNPGFANFYSGENVTASPLTLQSAFRQAYDMYFAWCGRFTGNLAVYLLLLLPSPVYHLLSSLAFTLYILLMQICVFGRNWLEKLSSGWLLALAALTWLTIPSFGEAFLWLSVGGQIALLAQLLMLLPYRLALQSADKASPSQTSDFILAPLFFLAGMATSSLDFPTSAALPGTALSALAYIYFKQKIKPRKIPWILLGGALGLLIGAALTLKAPGNAQRLLLTHDISVLSWLSLSWPQRIADWFFHLPLLPALFPIPLIILTWGLFSFWRRKGKNFYKFVPKAALLFLLPFCLTISAYLFTAWPPPRAFATCGIQLLLCSLIIAEKGLSLATSSLMSKWRFLKLILIICAISTIIWQGFIFYKLHHAIAIRDKIIASTSGDELLLPPLNVPANSYQPLGGELADISEDANFWVNRAMALHYNFKTVRKVSPDKKIIYQSSERGLLQDISLFLDKDRLSIQTENASLAKLLEKGAYIYYYGRPALLSKLWNPVANKIYTSLAGLHDGDMLLYLIPLLMARTKLIPVEGGAHLYTWRGPIIHLDNAETIWLVRPGEGSMSFNLVPFINGTEDSKAGKKPYK